jgi:excisionase family DNA binding protein
MPDETPLAPADEIPIAEAAQRSGVPKRTIYRWLQSRRLRSRTVGGDQLVPLADVVALAASRNAGSAGPRAGVNAGNGTTNGTRMAPVAQVSAGSPDGALAAEVFAAFEEGKQPVQVVQELELPPQLVHQLWRQFEDLRNVGRATGPTLAERVEVVEATLGTQLTEVAAVRSRVEQVAAHLAELPLPPRSRFTCECGAHGLVATRVQCSSCGREDRWGFFPPR